MGRRKRKHSFFFKIVMVIATLMLGTILGIAYLFYARYGEELKSMKAQAVAYVNATDEEYFKGNQTSVVYAKDGSIISRLKGSGDSTYISYEKMPLFVSLSMVSVEDKKFFRHDGVDYRALLRAAVEVVKTGSLSQGGSTITMQLARNTFLNQEKTWNRKVQEIFIAWELEKKYTKEEILEFYLNRIYFGNGYYGIGAASRGYFNKSLERLSLSQIAFLCAIPNNPTLYDPIKSIENTLARRDRILKNMVRDGKISQLDYASAIAENIVLEQPQAVEKKDSIETFAYYCATRALMQQKGFAFQYTFVSDYEKARYQEAYEQMYEACQRELRTKGYHIETSIDLKHQELLQKAVDTQLSIDNSKNEEGVYKLQASAVCINNETGYVEAIVGGRSQEFSFYTLNRAYQSFRQPGSAIKPLIVYTPMLERGYTAEHLVIDEEIEGGPKNANGTYLGEITIQTAVENSVNVIAWKLFEELTPKVGLGYLEKMQFSHLDAKDERLTTALGGMTNGVSSLEMAAAYATLQNDGIYREPTCIKRITDGEGNIIYNGEGVQRQVYQHNAARAMTKLLTGVMEEGTGKDMLLSQMPCAGKTGTTNDSKDGWFVGYTRYFTTSVWVGYDLPKEMKDLRGNTYPGYIWKNFMEEVHKDLPILDFRQEVQIDSRE